MQKELLEEALQYIDVGHSVVPVNGKKALPEWAEFQTRIPTKQEMTGWFEKYGESITGLGLILGEVSDLVVLDIDKKKDAEEVDLSGIDIPVTVIAKSGSGGRHFYFQYPVDFDVSTIDLRKFGINGELRSNKSMIVLPPSRHPDGGTYEWIGSPLLEKTPVDIPQWLIDKTKEARSSNIDWQLLAGGVSEGSRHTTATQMIGKLLRYVPENIWEAYAWPLIQGWNELNNPPLPHAELQDTFNGIARREKSNRPGTPADSKFSVISIDQLLDMKFVESRYLIDKIVPFKGITMLSGQPGAGKSWIMLSIAESVASGNKLWDMFDTQQGGVLIVDEENGDMELQRRIKMLNSEEKLPIYLSIQQSVMVDNEQKMKDVMEKIKELDISLVIIDPFASIHNANENSADEMQKVLKNLQQLTQIGVTVICIHHHRKENGFKKTGASQNLRGSSAISGRLDSHVSVDMITSDEEGIEVVINHDKARRGAKVQAFKAYIKFFKVGDADKFAIEHRGEADTFKLKKDEVKEIIIQIIGTDKMFAPDIAEAVKSEMKISDTNILKAIRELEDDLVIQSEKEGKKKIYFITQEQIAIE